MDFEIWKFSLHLNQGLKKCSWSYSLSSEDISAASLCGDGSFILCFIFWHYGKCLQQLAIACDSNNIGVIEMTTSQHVSHISTVKANFKSYSIFSNSGYGQFFQPLRFVRTILGFEAIEKQVVGLMHEPACLPMLRQYCSVLVSVFSNSWNKVVGILQFCSFFQNNFDYSSSFAISCGL